MRAYERLLKYVQIHTASSEETGVTPSTPGQWDLARALVDELNGLGLENPSVNEHCIVTAWLPASPGCEGAPRPGPAGPHGYRSRLLRGECKAHPP